MLLNIFQNRAFSAIELTATLQDTPYRPEFLGQFGELLFPVNRSRFRVVAVIKRKDGMALIPVSPIGAPPVELEGGSADARYFATRRLAKGSTVYAEELQGVLAQPDFQQVVAGVAAELATRALTIRADIELTHEHMRLGAIFGKVVDADGVRILDDWFANWGIAEPTAFNFNLDVATTNVRSICTDVRDAMFNASPGSWIQGRTEIHALAGGGFFKMLTSHPTIERVYLNTQNALQLGQEQADVWEWGGITFHKYRGTPNGEFSVGDEEVRFFPLGARDAFQRVAGPGEFAPFINTPGQDVYGITVPDRDRDAWTRYEGYSYPLYMCLRPEMLQKGVAR
jgi:hypothetical protein